MKYLKKFENKNSLLDILAELGRNSYDYHDIERVKQKIWEHQDEINMERWVTPLQITIQQLKNVELTKELIKAGADVNLKASARGETPIFKAVCTDILDMVKVIIDAGANVNIGNTMRNNPPLIIAYERYRNINDNEKEECLQIVHELIKAGADWNLKDSTNADRNHEDFIYYTNFYKQTKYFAKLYPDKYREYLIKKDSEEYNL